MSFVALAWAAKQRPGNLAAKMILLGLANFADEHGCAYPSTAALAEFGDMDHKTATAALGRLVALGLLEDTGRRVGKTGQIKVYRLRLDPARDDVVPGQVAYTYVLSHPATGEFYIGMRCCAGSPHNDRYFGSGLWPKRMAAQGVILTKDILSVFDSPNECRAEERALIEEAAGDPLCRNVEFNRPKKTPVKTGILKTPVSPPKDPQKRGTDTVREPAPKKDKPSLVAHELPDDWEPADFGIGTKSRKLVDGWPPGELEHQLEHFRAHHRKSRAKWKDWQATWATWVLNSPKFGAGNGRSAPLGRHQPDDGIGPTGRSAMAAFPDVFGPGRGQPGRFGH